MRIDTYVKINDLIFIMAFTDLLIGGLSTLSSLGSLGGAVYANNKNLQIAREANQAQKELAEYQYDRNIDLWNMNNAYNTPQAQMRRYLDAGLNPNLIYGSGSASSGNSQQPSEYRVQPLHVARVENPVPTSAQFLMNGLTQYFNMKKTAAETAAVYQNIANLEQDNKLKQLMVVHQGYVNSKTKEESDVWRRMLESQISSYDTHAVLNFANSQLADSNRFTVDAMRPYLVANAKENVDQTIANTISVRLNNSLYGLRREHLVNQIANLIANTQLSISNRNYTDSRTQLNKILIENGLDISNDEFDRLFYNLGLNGEDSSVPKGVMRLGSSFGRTLLHLLK